MTEKKVKAKEKTITPIPKSILEKKHGAFFSGTISGNAVIGKICVENGNVYLCQNKNNGAACSMRFGFKYSWAYDNSSKVFSIGESDKEFKTAVNAKTKKDVETIKDELYKGYAKEVIIERAIATMSTRMQCRRGLCCGLLEFSGIQGLCSSNTASTITKQLYVDIKPHRGSHAIFSWQSSYPSITKYFKELIKEMGEGEMLTERRNTNSGNNIRVVVVPLGPMLGALKEKIYNSL